MEFPDLFLGKKARKMPDIFERDDEQIICELRFCQVRVQMEADPKAPVEHRREAVRYGALPPQAETVEFLKRPLYDIAMF
jgi:hypothetical protein